MFGLEKNVVENLIAIVCGVLIFNSLIRFPFLGKYFETYPALILLIALVLLANKDKLSNVLGNGKI